MIEMMQKVKWFLMDTRSMIICMELYPKIKKLREGDRINWKGNEVTYIGLNHYGLSDGFLPQYSVLIELDDGSYHEISPEVILKKKRSAA